MRYLIDVLDYSPGLHALRYIGTRFSMSRSLGRDIPTEALGGLTLTNGVTNANLYSMTEVFLFFSGDYVLQDEDVTDIFEGYPEG